MTQVTVDQALKLAYKHHQAGRLQQAEQLYRQILAEVPDNASAMHYLGLIAHQVGRVDDAVDLIRRAIAHKGDYAEAYSNLGIALRDQGRLDDAIAAYRRAISLRPGFAEACNNLGNALIDTGQLAEAITIFKQSIGLNADVPEVHNNLGNALRNNGKLDEAIAAYRNAISLRPNYPEAFNNLGSVLKDKGQLDEAIAAYRQAIALRPGHARAHSNLLYTLHFHEGYSAQAIFEEHRLWNRRHAEPFRHTIRPHTNDRDPNRRLKIGYVSPDFREHPVGNFLLPLMECHDHVAFEIVCYADVRVPDGLTERLRGCADQWRSIVGMSDAQVAERIRQDGIDILVDLTMHMSGDRLLVFARKPAPVQVTWLAYPGTTGLETMDYRLTDRTLDPQIVGEAQSNTGTGEDVYVERSVCLPDCWFCYRSATEAPAVNPLPALTTRYVTFGCLNNFCKVSHEALACWASLMREVPGSRLLLHAMEGRHRESIQDYFARERIDPARLSFVGHLPRADYFRRYYQIDLCLDPFPYSGGMTSCDSLWMGVPVVSLSGPMAVGRLTATVLHNAGLPEWVAKSPEKYIEIAKELAGDLSRLSQTRSTLRERMLHSPLMDEPRFARSMESAYRDIWRR